MSEANIKTTPSMEEAVASFSKVMKETTERFVEQVKSNPESSSTPSKLPHLLGKAECIGILAQNFMEQLQSIAFGSSNGENAATTPQSGLGDAEMQALVKQLVGTLKIPVSTLQSAALDKENEVDGAGETMGSLAVCSTERRKDHTPDLLTLEEIEKDDRATAMITGAPNGSSANYLPKTPRHLQKNGPETRWDYQDEYRDDDDPGYRIRDIYETDLLLELQAKLNRPLVYASIYQHPVKEATPEQKHAAKRIVERIRRKRLAHQQAQEHYQQQQIQQQLNNSTAALPMRPIPAQVLPQLPVTNAPAPEHAAAPADPRSSIDSTRLINELEGAISPERVPQKDNSGAEGGGDDTPDQASNAVQANNRNHTPLSSNGSFHGGNDVEADANNGQAVASSDPNHAAAPPGSEQGTPTTGQQRELQNPVFETYGQAGASIGAPASGDASAVAPTPTHHAAPFINTSSMEDDLGEDFDPMADLTAEELEIESILVSGGGLTSPQGSLPGTILDPSTGQCVLVTDPDLRNHHRKIHADALQWASQYAAGSISKHREAKRKGRGAWQQKWAKNLRHPQSSDPQFPMQVPSTYTAADMTVHPTTSTLDCFHLRVVFDRDKTGFEERKELNLRRGDLVGGRYEVLSELGSAAFSTAVKCLDRVQNRAVCLKIIKNDKEFLDQSLDEIRLLRYINANCDPDESHVVRLLDFLYHREHLILVTELLRDNLYEYGKFIRENRLKPYFTLGRLQRITKQVLQALKFAHSLRLIHSDLKPENILVKHYNKCQIKVIDFGSSCFDDDTLSSYVQSRPYRAPEVILGLPFDTKVDIWSLGCIIAEIWTGYVLFHNDSIVSLLARVIGVLGPIPPYLLTRGKYVPQYFTQDGQLYAELDEPPCPQRGRKVRLLVPKKTSLWQRMRTEDTNFISFLSDALQIDPAKRPTAAKLLGHPWLLESTYPDGLSSAERRALHSQQLKESYSQNLPTLPGQRASAFPGRSPMGF